MSTIELRQLLIEKIQKTDDPDLLEEATRLFDVAVAGPEVYVLSASEKEGIETARQQIKDGECFTHEQANQLVNKWLNR